MQNRIKVIGKHTLYLIWSNVLFGIIVYVVFTWLAGFSLMLAFFGNLILIILGLALERAAFQLLRSPSIANDLHDPKDGAKNYRIVKNIIENFVSFKTALYLFYAVILIASQVLAFYPSLVSENVANFILINNYSILFLIAFDMIINQFARDKENMKAIAEALDESLAAARDSKKC